MTAQKGGARKRGSGANAPESRPGLSAAGEPRSSQMRSRLLPLAAVISAISAVVVPKFFGSAPRQDTAASRRAEASTAEPAQPLCCFTEADVTLERTGSSPDGLPVLQVDNFFCPGALRELVASAQSARWMEAWHHNAFPGHALSVQQWMSEDRIRTGPVAQLSAGEHIECFQRALRMLTEAGRFSAEPAFQEGAYPLLEGSGGALVEKITKATEEAKAGAVKSGALDEKQLKTLVGKAKINGLYNRSVGEWALMSLMNNKTRQRHLAEAESMRLSYISVRPQMSDMHLDNGVLVVNIPLAAGSEDTGTSFWRAHPLQPGGKSTEYCGGEVSAMRHCIIAISRYWKQFMAWKQELPPGEALSFSHGSDDTKVYEEFHNLPFRQNRAVVYSGHIVHSSSIPPEAQTRMTSGRQKGKDISKQRLLFQDFVSAPALGAAFLKRQLVEKDQAGLRKFAMR